MRTSSARAALAAASVLLAVLAPPARAQAPLGGEWSLRAADAAEAPPGGTAVMHVALWAPGLSTELVPLSALEGLAAEQLAAAESPARFTLRRDAGTFTFVGPFRRGRGSGRFEFAPDPAFADALARRGMARPTPEQQLSLARHDVGLAYLDELAAQGYAPPTTDALVRAGAAGAGLDELRALGARGVRLGTLDALTRQHAGGGAAARPVPAGPSAGDGSTPTTGRWTLASIAGESFALELFWDDATNWPARAVAFSELHGAAPRDIAAFTPVPVAFRIERDAGDFEFEGQFYRGRGTGTFRYVPDRRFADTLRAIGVAALGEVTDHELKNLAYADVSAAAVRDFRALGLPSLTKRELVDLAIFQVTPEFVRRLRDSGLNGLSAQALIDLRRRETAAARRR